MTESGGPADTDEVEGELENEAVAVPAVHEPATIEPAPWAEINRELTFDVSVSEAATGAMPTVAASAKAAAPSAWSNDSASAAAPVARGGERGGEERILAATR